VYDRLVGVSCREAESTIRNGKRRVFRGSLTQLCRSIVTYLAGSVAIGREAGPGTYTSHNSLLDGICLTRESTTDSEGAGRQRLSELTT